MSRNSEKVEIRIEPLGVVRLVNKGTPLKDILFEYGVEFPCGGKGYCGGCKVKLLRGDVKNPEKHKELNYKLGLEPGYRLACQSEIVEDITLEIPQFESIILADSSKFSFVPLEGFGIAVDVGTTTIVAQLINLCTGQVVDVRTARNPQARFGADIMNRIQYALTEKGRNELMNLIREKIYHLIIHLLKNKKIELKKVVLVGNTVMHHLFCGFDLKQLSGYPFETTNNESKKYIPSELGWDLLKSVQIIFVRPIAGFVGSDIYAGIIASGMDKNPDLTALIDLGTNGEIVVGNMERMVCASTAAGPAFEGAVIHMGMSAMSGAISSVSFNNSHIEYHVIGNQEPRGICGSGLIDAVAVFLEKGLIDPSGVQIDNEKPLYISEEVYLTQKDVREFQLAKAALAAGMKILINKFGKSLSDIARVYIAGSFGNFINLENVTKLGMLEVGESKIQKLGNSALIGAKMLLFTDDYDFETTLSKIEHVSLDANVDFQDLFVRKMFFHNFITEN